MSNQTKIGIGVCATLIIGGWLYSYFAIGKDAIPYTQNSAGKATTSVSFAVEEFATGLMIPWSMVWTSPSRMLVSERPGRIRVIENGVLAQAPLHRFAEVSVGGEEGLMSLAVDPAYETNKFLYACLAYETGADMFVKIVRMTDAGASLTGARTIVDHIPAASFHAGCRIAFGPDGKLYASTGDATNRLLAQDLGSLAGKVLRMNADGSVPADNPFTGSRIYSYGHRNPQGIAWDPATGTMYETEHGPSLFDGPAGGDEVNQITRGSNYGWPLVSHENTKDGTVAPLLVFTPAEAPGSALVYSGKLFPQFAGNLFFGALKGEGVVRVILDPDEPDTVASFEKISAIQFGRIRDVAEGPDGFIYFSTSNRDGRGKPDSRDDRIFRIRPKINEQ